MAQKEKKHALLLGRYEMGKLLGQGAFAKVYHARNVETKEEVAIKIIDKKMILQVGLTAHVKREVLNLRMVMRHPNIVQLLEVMATKLKIYFVMEYVRGGELFSKMANGSLKEDEARKYFQQLISAVGFCHARGVFHRDLKPENLLLDENGDLKVTDFGLSAVSDQTGQDGLFHTFCGTPAFLAPEVLTRKGYDAATVDVWSCGVILFVLVAGYLPFRDASITMLYRKICMGQFRCPTWFSPELVHLMRRLLDKNPENRITIPEIMEHRWFKKGFKRLNFYINDVQVCNVDDERTTDDPETSSKHRLMSESENEPLTKKRKVSELPRPTSMNAFDLISYTVWFDLSGMFEGGERSMLVSHAPVSSIVAKLEEIAKNIEFRVRKQDLLFSMEGSREGSKGPLTIDLEIFELLPTLMVVEVKKKSGDKGAYNEVFLRVLKPAIEGLKTVEASDEWSYSREG